MNDRTSINRFQGEFEFLSNFYSPAPTEVEGILYPNSEAAYVAGKVTDLEIRQKVAKIQSPGAVKKMGRRLAVRPDWEAVKVLWMRKVLRAKFTQNPDLKEKLLATGDRILIEGNYWHDNCWGNCFCAKCAQIKGENHLGIELMRLRQELREEETAALCPRCKGEGCSGCSDGYVQVQIPSLSSVYGTRCPSCEEGIGGGDSNFLTLQRRKYYEETAKCPFCGHQGLEIV